MDIVFEHGDEQTHDTNSPISKEADENGIIFNLNINIDDLCNSTSSTPSSPTQCLPSSCPPSINLDFYQNPAFQEQTFPNADVIKEFRDVFLERYLETNRIGRRSKLVTKAAKPKPSTTLSTSYQSSTSQTSKKAFTKSSAIAFKSSNNCERISNHRNRTSRCGLGKSSEYKDCFDNYLKSKMHLSESDSQHTMISAHNGNADENLFISQSYASAAGDFKLNPMSFDADNPANFNFNFSPSISNWQENQNCWYIADKTPCVPPSSFVSDFGYRLQSFNLNELNLSLTNARLQHNGVQLSEARPDVATTSNHSDYESSYLNRPSVDTESSQLNYTDFDSSSWSVFESFDVNNSNLSEFNFDVSENSFNQSRCFM